MEFLNISREGPDFVAGHRRELGDKVVVLATERADNMTKLGRQAAGIGMDHLLIHFDGIDPDERKDFHISIAVARLEKPKQKSA